MVFGGQPEQVNLTVLYQTTRGLSTRIWLQPATRQTGGDLTVSQSHPNGCSQERGGTLSSKRVLAAGRASAYSHRGRCFRTDRAPQRGVARVHLDAKHT